MAHIFGISVKTLAGLAHGGELPYVLTLGGHRRYRRDDVRALLEKRKPVLDPVRAAMEEDAVRLYRQGWSVRQVAQRFGCSYGAMHRILARHSALRERR